MNNNMPPPPPPPYQKSHPQSSFPQDLPPRNLRQTWWQRNGFKSKPFFTLYVLNKSTHPYLNNTPHLRPLAKLTPVRRHYHSFSLRNHHGAREIWRRVSMWIIMLVRLIQVILLATLSIAGVYWSGPGYIVLIVFLALIALGLLLVSAWNLALIGDAAGTRRAMGVVVRRNGLDWFLHIMTLAQVVLTSAFVLWAVWAVWAVLGLSMMYLSLGLVVLVVALVASMEPADQYGTGV